MSKLVFDAIGKYIHPTRYRQIVETESLNQLTREKQRILSEDQKHTRNIRVLLVLFSINASEIARSSMFEILLHGEISGAALGRGVMNKLLSSSLDNAPPAFVPPAFCCEHVDKNPSSSLVDKASKMLIQGLFRA